MKHSYITKLLGVAMIVTAIPFTRMYCEILPNQHLAVSYHHHGMRVITAILAALLLGIISGILIQYFNKKFVVYPWLIAVSAIIITIPLIVVTVVCFW